MGSTHGLSLRKPSKPSWSHFFLLLSVMNMMLLKLLNTSLSKTQMIRERASWKTTREKKDSLSVLLGPAFYFTIFAFITSLSNFWISNIKCGAYVNKSHPKNTANLNWNTTTKIHCKSDLILSFLNILVGSDRAHEVCYEWCAVGQRYWDDVWNTTTTTHMTLEATKTYVVAT